MLWKRFENWLVLFDDLFCDTTQLVNINQTTVNLPFSLFSIYIFPTHYLFLMSIIGSIQFNYFKWLTCCLRSFSLDFDLVRLDFLPDFPKLFFLLQYLSIFWESTLARVSVYIQASTLDAQSKALKMFRTSRKITNKISRTFL